jgi:hypothetical protein
VHAKKAKKKIFLTETEIHLKKELFFNTTVDYTQTDTRLPAIKLNTLSIFH